MRFMRDGLEDRYGFLELQDKILEIAVDVDRFCASHGIDYCLMGGSALGAKRHGGFIPWDDDLDIFMTPDNYEKFRDAFRAEGDQEKYYLQDWGAVDGMVTIAKLRMNGTTYIEDVLKDWDMHHGIYIDIFILHTCPDGKLAQYRQCLWGKYIVIKGLSHRNPTRRGGFLGFVMRVMRLLPRNFLVRHGLKQVYKHRGKQTAHYCNFLGKAVFRNAIYDRKWFETTAYAPFEKVELRVPKGLHDFLSDRFGDYMKIPSPEQIKWEQHAASWDIVRDFREELSSVKNFSDEANLL